MSRGRGVRTITLAPPSALGAEERKELEKRRGNFVNVCLKWADTFRKREWVEFKVPGPVEKETIHFWFIVAHGMSPHDVIRVDRGEGFPAMNAHPASSGVAHMSLMLNGEQPAYGVGLELVGSRQAGDRDRAMSIQQVRFERRAALPVRGGLRALRFERGFNGRRLIIVDRDREMTWDISVPSAPTLLSTMAHAHDKDSERIGLSTRASASAPDQREVFVMRSTG